MNYELDLLNATDFIHSGNKDANHITINSNLCYKHPGENFNKS